MVNLGGAWILSAHFRNYNYRNLKTVLIMLLFNLAFFLAVTAIIVAFVNPKSKTQIWLYSIVIPILLAFVIAVFEASFSESRYSFSNKIAESIGGSLISIIVAIITLFVCLKRSLMLVNNTNYLRA